MIAVRVGHDRAVDGSPGVDEEVAGLAVEAAIGDAKQRHSGRPGAWRARAARTSAEVGARNDAIYRGSMTAQATRSPELPLGSVRSSSAPA